MEIKKIDLLFVAISAVAIVALATASDRWIEGSTSLVIAILCSSTMLLCYLEVYRRMQKSLERVLKTTNELNANNNKLLANHYKQIESLLSVFKFVDLIYPLPETRGWAASPDFLKQIIEIVYSDRPKIVVEASSGVSTVIIGYCLKKNGCGKVISFEHEEKYIKATQKLINLHGLQDFVELVHAPLKSISIHGEQHDWYDISDFSLENTSIDLLVVDGPPGASKKLARYPALPMMYEQLSHNAKVILDDGKRNDEKEIARMWQKEWKVDCSSLNLEKGGFLFSKR